MPIGKVWIYRLLFAFAFFDRPAGCSASTHAKYTASHRMVIKPFPLLDLAAKYRVVRRPSDVYNTHRQTKLTMPEMISCSRDMVGGLVPTKI